MAAGRKTQPLFDLVRGKGTVKTPEDRRNSLNPGVGWRPGMVAPAAAGEGASSGTGGPSGLPGAASLGGGGPATSSAEQGGGPRTGPMRVELKPATHGPAREHVSDAAPHSDLLLAGGRVRLPLSAISLLIAALIALVILAYAIGSRRERKSTEVAAARMLPTISEPGEGSSGAEKAETGGGIRPDNQIGVVGAEGGVGKGRTVGTGGSVAPPAGAKALTGAGWLGRDPREEGQNYLLLASMNQTEAESAVVFLGENGLETFALWLDPAKERVNNSDSSRPYRLYVTRGISSDEYSKKMTARTNIEAAVARLGPRWQKERRGSSNFAKPDWQKMSSAG